MSLKEVERLKDENELHARQLRLLTETTPHMLWSATPDGLVDYVNQRMLDYAQLTNNEFLGVAWGTAIHPDHVQRMREAWALRRLANRHLAGLQHYVETGHRRLNWSAI